MTEQVITASQLTIKVDGNEIQSAVMDSVLEVTVDQHTQLPWMFTIKLYDQDLEYIDEGPFDLTKEVEILAQKDDRSPVTLIKGEITALEPRFNEGMTPELLVRGYDKSHRLSGVRSLDKAGRNHALGKLGRRRIAESHHVWRCQRLVL